MSFFQSFVSPCNGTAALDSTAVASVPSVRPRYDVEETTDAFKLVVQLPGVSRENLEITAEDDVIRITGRRDGARPDGWTPLYRESSAAAFELTLSHDHAINLDAVQAELKDGVLRASLPKTEAVKPRKIAVA